MSKEDWLEYFEAVNGRSATEEEIAQALAAGEFVEAEQVSAEQASSEASPASSSFEQPQNFQQPFAQQASQQYQEVPQQQANPNQFANQGQAYQQQGFQQASPFAGSLSLLVRKLIRTTSSKDSSIHKYLNKDHRLITVSNLLNPASFLKQ